MGKIQRAVKHAGDPGKKTGESMPRDDVDILVNEIVHSNKTFAKCILFEPENTLHQDTENTNTALAQTVSMSEAVATANDEGDENDEGHDEDSAREIDQSGGFQISAATRSVSSACSQNSLEIKDGNIFLSLDNGGQVPLEVWQATGIDWMAQQEQSPIHGGILADGCGLGKTRMAYGLIYQASLQYSRTGKYRLTLILCPKRLVDMWYKEATDHFPEIFDIKVFYGIRSKVPINDRDICTISKLEELVEFLVTLDYKK
ncbi:hypothetical protein N7456_005240 [Penicillium angulare]|uniref:SNF2 N-terminal domain-containing protein n=1 Tax=Penicillium angulare TaxID=116970 RepID=A0A9W9FY22_9EURO|nr:hypothetical protein N7456_005240 [Penicillium angulare]